MASKIPQVTKVSSKFSVLLDSNVWRYIIDKKAGGALLRHTREGSFDILIAPAVVYEALRLKDAPLRNAIVRLMTDSAFRRLMPEAYSESMELLREIERVRPDWLRAEPELEFFNRLLNDWRKSTGGFWVRCKRSPGREAQFLTVVEGDMMRHTQEQAKNARREMIEGDWKRNPRMDKTVAAFKAPVPGWRGDEFEAWRSDGLTVLTHSLSRRGNAYRDWVAPFGNLTTVYLAAQRGWNFGSISPKNAPCPANGFGGRSPSHSDSGNYLRERPATASSAQYFLEADAVITADKVLLEILEEIRPYAPCDLPKGHFT